LAGCRCLRAGQLGNLCGGDSPKETAPGVIQMEMAWVDCMATSISLKDGLRLSQTAKAGQKCPGFRYCFVETKEAIRFGRDGGFLQKIEGWRGAFLLL
jgi:hypothetical protein